MDTKELQDLVKMTFKSAFGYTPLTERQEDILREAIELTRSTGVKNLKEETGDLLSSVIMLCVESGWDFSELVEKTCKVKIRNRASQYKSLGRKLRVAVLGGAFDPITKGHIQLAQFVLDTSREFDEVWLTPCYKHLYGKKMASSEDRLAMCRLAAEVDGRIQVWDYEIKEELGGETYNLVKRLHNDTLMEDHNFSFIIGQDNANTFDKWVNYEHLEKMARFIIVPRKGIKPDPTVDWYRKSPHVFLVGEDGGTDIMEVSSTEVRGMVKDYEEYEELLHDELCKVLDKKVIDYILAKDLYKEK